MEPTTGLSDISTRLERIRNALTLAAAGAFGEARSALENPSQDEFGSIEGLLHALIIDYEAAIRQNELSLEEFKLSKEALLKQALLSQSETIRRQQAEIQTLSAPIIDVGDNAVAIPLIGAIDSARLGELSARLLERVAAMRISWVLIDLTGIESVEAEPVGKLLRMAAAIRLMGATCLWTGMPPNVAKILVSLGTPLEGITSMASLKDGLRYCARRGGSSASDGTATPKATGVSSPRGSTRT